MKRLISLTLSVCMLAGLLAGCTVDRGNGSALENYRTLLEDMENVEEYAFAGEISMSLTAAMGSLMNATVDMSFGMTGTTSRSRDEQMMKMYTVDRRGNEQPFTDVITIGPDTYLNVVDAYTYMFDLYGVSDLMGTTWADLLGPDTYVILPDDDDDDDDDDLSDVFPFSVESFDLSDEVLEQYMSVEDEVYTISMQGEQLRGVLDQILDEVDELLGGDGDSDIAWILTLYDVELTEDMVEQMISSLDTDDLDGFSYSSSISYAFGTYTEKMELVVPGLLTLSVNGQTTGQEVEPLTAPEDVITQDEVDALDFDELFGGGGVKGGTSAPDTLVNLEDGMTIIGHAPGDSGLLANRDLVVDDDEVYADMLILKAGRNTDDAAMLYSYTDGLSFYYSVFYYEPSSEFMAWILDQEKEYYGDSGSNFRFTPIRCNSSDTMAFATMRFTDSEYGEALSFYFVEAVEDMDAVIILQMELWLDWAEEDELEAVMEAGRIYGIDLAEYFIPAEAV